MSSAAPRPSDRRSASLSAKEAAERAAPRDRGGDVHVRSGPQMREYEAAADRIAHDGPDRVLDWGCGLGHMSYLLKARGLEVSAMEWDPECVEGETRRLERYPGVEATFTREPVRLPYDDGCFDAVLSMGVLEHVHDPHGSVAEIRRVLRPGGWLYVYKLPNRWSYLEFIARRAGLFYHGQLEHDVIYTVASARALVERHGFDVLVARRANMLPLSVPGAFARRHADRIWSANRALARVPGLNQIATNVELIARRP